MPEPDPRRLRVERHRDIGPAPEQLGLIEKRAAAKRPVLAAEDDQMVRVRVRQIEQIARVAAEASRMAALDRGVCRLQQRFIAAQPAPIDALPGAADAGYP